MKQAQVLSERDIKRVLAAIAKRSYSSRDRATTTKQRQQRQQEQQ